MIESFPTLVMCEHERFFSTSHHVMMVLTEIHDLYHDSKCKPYKQTLKANPTVTRHYE